MASNRPIQKVAPLMLILAALGFLLLSPSLSPRNSAGVALAAVKPEMSHFLLIVPHTAEQCLAALDAVVAEPNGGAELAKWDWGCMAGDHTGYLLLSAATGEEALKSVPKAERAGAKAIKLNKFTAEQVKSFHEMKH
jgi:hypothetical protein